MTDSGHKLYLKHLGIDTYKEPIIYIHEESPVCRAEGFESQGRILISYKDQTLIATLNKITGGLLGVDQVGLSKYAWSALHAVEGDPIEVKHPPPVRSLSQVRSKIYGNKLSAAAINEIIQDIVSSRYSDIEIASFVTACAGNRLDEREIIDLTQAMIDAGVRVTWPGSLIVDKHCVGGLPGNRTTPIVVSIVAAFGLTMPKTSSRAITSPAGTADAMEVLAPVDLDILSMRRVVEQENGCIIWGGAVALSPADDLLIRIEKILDLDSEGQLVASILSKKVASGSSHVLIDIPVGPTAKVRSIAMAEKLSAYLERVGKEFGLTIASHISDGTQPIGRGIGPALEARDFVSVLQNKADAPQDLRKHALDLAGKVLEFSPNVSKGDGLMIAQRILDSGEAWKKFQAICQAQGGMREIPTAQYIHIVKAERSGIVEEINNRYIARVAKLAGAPTDKAAGVDLYVSLNTSVEKGQPLFSIHAESPGELNYALSYLQDKHKIIQIKER